MASECGGWRPGNPPGVATEWLDHTGAHVNDRPCYTHRLVRPSQQTQQMQRHKPILIGKEREAQRGEKAAQGHIATQG